jgi:ABC-type lipoprotein export system ATPase subunit
MSAFGNSIDELVPRRIGLPVRCVSITHVYRTPDEDVTALDSVSFTVPAGGRLAIVGPSGSGKSTLLTLLAGLHRPTAGELWIGEDDLAALPERRLLSLRGTTISTVVQNPGRNLLPYGTAEDNIRFAQRCWPRGWRAELPRPMDLLEHLGLAPLAGRPVARLSGGEQQRVSIAVGLASGSGLLLLDEPTSQLDAGSRDRVVDLLSVLTEAAGCTVLAVTHDPAVAEALGASISLAGGRVVNSSGGVEGGGVVEGSHD